MVIVFGMCIESQFVKYVKMNLVPKKFGEILWGEVKIDALKG